MSWVTTFLTYWNACIKMTLIQTQTDLLHTLPLSFPAFLEFTLLGILERGDMDILSQLELKDVNVRPVFESPDNLNILFIRHMTCTNTFEERFVSFSFVPLSFCPVLVHFLFGGVRSLAVNCPVLAQYLCDQLCVLSAPYSVRESLDQQRRRRSPPDNFLPERLYPLDVR